MVEVRPFCSWKLEARLTSERLSSVDIEFNQSPLPQDHFLTSPLLPLMPQRTLLLTLETVKWRHQSPSGTSLLLGHP